MTQNVLYCDIDGTLLYTDSCSDCLKISSENRFISKKVSLELQKMLNEGWRVVLITGRRITSYNRIAKIIPHTSAYIEHGGVLVSSGVARKLISDEESYLLDQCKVSLEKKSFFIDDVDRVATFCITSRYSKPLSFQDKVDLQNYIEDEYPLLRVIQNEKRLDIGLKKVNKMFAMKHFEIPISDFSVIRFALGNDFNDIEMLEESDIVGCPLTSVNELKEVVFNKNGIVAENSSHSGILELLQEIQER